MSLDLVQYADLLSQIKQRIRQGQTLAVMSANAEMIGTYWDVGKMINDRQKLEGWGAAVIPRLSRDIHNELPDIKGFSERNIKRMLSFYREYSSCSEFVPRAVAQIETSGKVPQAVAQTATPAILPQLVARIPWGHNILLVEKVKDLSSRLWYMRGDEPSVGRGESCIRPPLNGSWRTRKPGRT